MLNNAKEHNIDATVVCKIKKKSPDYQTKMLISQ